MCPLSPGPGAQTRSHDDELCAALRDPSSYPMPVTVIEERETHISHVFLAGPWVYKVKKPVDFGFLDFSTLSRREHLCREEVRLNRRLAPDVYLGVVPIAYDAGGQLRVEGEGDVFEWAVKMRRLDDDHSLRSRLHDLDVGIVDRVARRLAAFHSAQPSTEEARRNGSFDVVAGNARENFSQTMPHIGRTVHAAVHRRLTEHTEAALTRHAALITARAAAGMPRDTHGDLRLEHVYLEEEALTVIDCIEFNARFRYADPVADIAFLAMELGLYGRRDLVQPLLDGWFAAMDDPSGRELLPLYAAYRAIVRAKVDGFALSEATGPRATALLTRARAEWMEALHWLEAPVERPAIVAIGGLPGTGKSTLARAVAAAANFEVIRSDVVRKELAGLEPTTHTSSAFGAGLYSPEWTDRTYAACLERAEQIVFEGRRAIVDATFGSPARLDAAVALARRLNVPLVVLECTTSPELVHTRLDARVGDASDADWGVYKRAEPAWTPLAGAVRIDTEDNGAPQALAELRRRALHG